MSRIDDTIQAKKEKRRVLEDKQHVVIHPYSFNKKLSIVGCRKLEGQENNKVKTAGRIMSWRNHGKVVFLDLQDDTGKIQVMLHQDNLDKEFDSIGFIDTGDFLGVEGKVVKTQTGEITIEASSFTFLGKSLRPLPTVWNAIDDKEIRFRKRYLDLLVNPEAKRVLDARWLILKEIRQYLQGEPHNFAEVETPILQSLYGGTNATPFTTYMKALDTDFYLRVAPELYLKRLITGGYERIFEIARNFRNEGIDQTHQPEFTMIEWYQAYADYHIMMDTAEGLVKHLVQKLNEKSGQGGNNFKLKVYDQEVDVSKKWSRVTMLEALKKYAQIDFEKLNEAEVKALLVKHEIGMVGEITRGKAMFALFDKLVTPYLLEPIWIIDYPRDVSPLAKQHRLHPELAERFEGYIGGKELADGWSEIVDSIDQRQVFENEQKNMRGGDTEAHPMDDDFLESMEYGLPPLGGIGMGIDRLVMFLTNTWSIKEVIAFPTLRPIRDHEVKPVVRESAGVVEKTGKTEKNAGKIKEIVVKTKTGVKTEKNSGSLPFSSPLPSRDFSNRLLPSREQAEALLTKYIKNEKLRHHCKMVAWALEAYARSLGEDEAVWYQTGLLHDLDWEMFPDEHPNKAVKEILADYPGELLSAIEAHAPGRTGKNPETLLARYLFACDELSGLMHAVSLMRPEGFVGMSAKSIKKKMKDKSFAANVSRDDIKKGFELISKQPDEHINFLIEVFGG